MLQAYCDESLASDIKTTPIYVVAGFVGVPEQWQYFESLWRQSMKQLRIETIGCHAAKCAPGAGPYRHLTADQRYEIQHRLIVDIVATELYGVIAIIDMNAYRAHEGVLSRFFAPHDRQYYKPHVRAVEQCVQQMCRATENATRDPIAFVFDKNASGGAVRAAFEISRSNPGNPYRQRLGSYKEAGRTDAVALQAADMLAYAAFRNASGNPGWQWRELRPAIKAAELTTDEHFWSKLVQNLEAARATLTAE
jgi:hypothetical protein